MHQLSIDFKKAYDSLRREVLYDILIEFGIPMKLVRLIKVCLNETCSRIQVGKHLSDMFPIRNSLKQGDALSPLIFNLGRRYALRRVQVNQDGLKLNGIARSEHDGTSAETRFGLSAKRTSTFKSAGVSVHSIACSRGVRISRQRAYYL